MARKQPFCDTDVMKIIRFVAFVLGLPVVAACSAAQEFPADPLARNDWVKGDVSMAMLLEGTLEISNGCLVVRPDEVGDDVVVAFPRSLVEWDASTGVLTYGGMEYRIGDPVSMGGGGVPVSSDIDMPDACIALNMPNVFLLQNTTLEPWKPQD
jgi:hypothetical protein